MTKADDDDFDPSRVLDGWRARQDPPKPDHGPAIDLTRVLDGWQPDGSQPRRPHDDDVEDVPVRMVIETPEVVEAAPIADAELSSIGSSAARLARSLAVEDIEPAWQPSGRTLVPQRARDPRLLAAWRPGAWLGAARQVMKASAEVVDTPQGPLVESFPPHLLLALWPPQALHDPFVGRWPDKLVFVAVEADAAGDALLAQIPDEAPLWLSEPDIDWLEIAELALLHQPALRPFQVKGLRAFIEAERDLGFKQRNDLYHQPDPRGPVQKKADADG